MNTFYHFRMFTQITIAFKIRGNHYLITDYLLVLGRGSVLNFFYAVAIGTAPVPELLFSVGTVIYRACVFPKIQS